MTEPRRILVVEDDPAVAQGLRAALGREGFAVTWAATGAEGVRAVRDTSPHLILLDVRLPDTLGFDLCRTLRQQGQRRISSIIRG